jgi:hypothetical protein
MTQQSHIIRPPCTKVVRLRVLRNQQITSTHPERLRIERIVKIDRERYTDSLEICRIVLF